MEFAYGELGLSPEELAGLTPFQFELKTKGYSTKRLKDEEIFRKLGWLTFAMNADPKASKGVTLDDIWPTTATVKRAKERNVKAKSKVYTSMVDEFKKRRGLK